MSSKSLKRIFICVIGLYAVMFVSRAVYDLVTYEDTDISDNRNIYYESEKKGVGNYASQRTTYTGEGVQSVLDLKYERVADIRTKTIDYDNDLEKLNGFIKENNAVIQAENREGIAGKRSAQFTIGVKPENFDAMEAAVSEIGRIVSKSASKTDKTYEYNQQVAEKAVLDQRLQSYLSLKQRGGSISEMLMLEDKIIEVQALIQTQMIYLGAYSDENALCTIRFTIYEGSETTAARKIWNSLIWTTQTYFLILLCISAMTAVVFILEAVWNYSKKTFVDKPAFADKPAADENNKAK